MAKALAKALDMLITTEVKEYANEIEIEVFPQPVNDLLNIKFHNNLRESVKLQIFDITGKLILQQTINLSEVQNNFTVDINNLNHGIYILNLNIGTHSVSQKIIKK